MNRAFLICQLLFSALVVSLSVSVISAQNSRRAVIVASATARVASSARVRTAAVSTSSIERQVFALINFERQKNGLSRLTWNERAAQAARVHCKDMANKGFFGHRGSDGSVVNDRARKQGLAWNAIGENIVFFRGYSNAADFAVESWMDSKAHKKNILNKNWAESGIGAYVKPDGTYFFTQVFVLPAVRQQLITRSSSKTATLIDSF
jgi:uncharacterized protein YkwD